MHDWDEAKSYEYAYVVGHVVRGTSILRQRRGKEVIQRSIPQVLYPSQLSIMQVESREEDPVSL